MEEETLSQDITIPGVEPENGGSGGRVEGVLTAPSVVQGGSGRYQPASQPAATQHGAIQGQNSRDNLLSNVKLETSAGAGLGQPGKQQICSHTREGVCCVHGEGAKWRWRPIPIHRRTPGPDGKIKKREYFWQCDLNRNGKVMRQSKISLGQK